MSAKTTGTSRALSRRSLLGAAGLSLLPLTAAGCNRAGGGDYPSKAVRIMAPAGAGGGWDTTARAIQETLTNAGLANDVSVYNVDGAAGTTGLTQFVGKNQGDPHELMVTGLVMVGGIITAKSPVTLSDVTEIARLIAEQEVFVVPQDSPYKTINDLVDAAKKDPKSVNWGGGSAGGTDEILMLLLMQNAGGEPSEMKYIAASGGGESVNSLLNGDIDVGISGPSEYIDQIKEGKLRPLAVSGAEAVDIAGKKTPTLKEAGYDVELMNWRSIVAPGGISDDDREGVIKLFEKLRDSKEWKEKLKKEGWEDYFNTGDEVKKFTEKETKRVEDIFKEVGKGK